MALNISDDDELRELKLVQAGYSDVLELTSPNTNLGIWDHPSRHPPPKPRWQTSYQKRRLSMETWGTTSLSTVQTSTSGSSMLDQSVGTQYSAGGSGGASTHAQLSVFDRERTRSTPDSTVTSDEMFDESQASCSSYPGPPPRRRTISLGDCSVRRVHSGLRCASLDNNAIANPLSIENSSSSEILLSNYLHQDQTAAKELLLKEIEKNELVAKTTRPRRKHRSSCQITDSALRKATSDDGLPPATPPVRPRKSSRIRRISSAPAVYPADKEAILRELDRNDRIARRTRPRHSVPPHGDFEQRSLDIPGISEMIMRSGVRLTGNNPQDDNDGHESVEEMHLSNLTEAGVAPKTVLRRTSRHSTHEVLQATGTRTMTAQPGAYGAVGNVLRRYSSGTLTPMPVQQLPVPVLITHTSLQEEEGEEESDEWDEEDFFDDNSIGRNMRQRDPKLLCGSPWRLIKYAFVAITFCIGIGIGIGIRVFGQDEGDENPPETEPENSSNQFSFGKMRSSCWRSGKIHSSLLSLEVRAKRDSFLNSLEFVRYLPDFNKPEYADCGIHNLAAYFTATSSIDSPRFQRYTLALLYLSQSKNFPRKLDGSWMSLTVDECLWEGVSCAIGRIDELDLSESQLEGQLPDELFLMKSLRKLNLASNSFEGSLPSSIRHLRKLELFNISGNKLEGLLPLELFSLTNLIDLHLDHNRFEGHVASDIGMLGDLRRLFVGHNFLSGPIPTQLVDANRLTVLSLAQNSLTSTIPSELGDLNLLQELDLGENFLVGSVPTQLGRLTNLRGLRLEKAGNSSLGFSGPIPTEFGSLYALTTLNLHGIHLTGTIPSELGNCLSLLSLDLSRNFLHGSVPESFGQLTRLTTLDLSGNEFLDDPSEVLCAALPSLKDLRPDPCAWRSLTDTLNGGSRFLLRGVN